MKRSVKMVQFGVYVCALALLVGEVSFALPTLHKSKSSLQNMQSKWEDFFIIDPTLNEEEFNLDEIWDGSDGLNSEIWSNCGKSSDAVQILSVSVNPNPPQKGESFTVSAKVKLSKQISSGSVKIYILYKKLVPIVKTTMKVCKLVKYFGESCPLSAGTHTVSYTQSFPSYALSGRYVGKVKASDSSGNELMCVSIDMTIS